MPTTQSSHEQLREKVCAVCYCRSGSKATKMVTERLEVVIKNLVFSEYSRTDEKFPSGLCLTCLFTLNDQVKGENTKHKNKEPRQLLLPDPEVYETEIRRLTRSTSEAICQCMICEVGRLNGLEWRRFAAKFKSKPSAVVMYEHLCKHCFAPIYRGSTHTEISCRSRREALYNATLAISNSNTSSDLLASQTLRSMVSDSGSSSVKVRAHTGGHPLSLTVGKSGEGPVQMSVNQAKTIQLEANLSDKQVNTVFKNLRLQFGRKAVEPGLREVLVEEKTRLDCFFSADNMRFSDNEGNTIIRPFVYCSDIVGFVRELARLRGFSASDLVLKIGIDGGKGFLKMILTLYDPSDVRNNNKSSRITRESGIGSGQDYSMLGRKKIMILAISPKTPENYSNLQIFYDMVGVNQVPYTQTGDFKALNIMLGMMSCASLCGCCYCDAKRSAKEWSDGGAQLRSAANLAENVAQYEKYGGGDKMKAKDLSANCIEKAMLFDEDDDPNTTVLLKCPPPALHLKLGLNNLLKELCKVWPPILDWLSSKHITLEPYHGGRTLEGNECSKVLKNLDSLEEVIPAKYALFLEVFKCFRDVVESCFGYLLDPYYKQVMAKFRAQMKKLQDKFNVSIPNKIHILCIHVEEFCSMVGRGLGEFSEQETENAHSAYDDIWDRYRVKDDKSEVYHKQFFKSVMNFNCNNI